MLTTPPTTAVGARDSVDRSRPTSTMNMPTTLRLHNQSRRRALLACLAIAAICALHGCSGEETTPLRPPADNPFVAFKSGSDTTLAVVTWNVRNFATDAGAEEVALAAQVVAGIAADIVALQEIAQWPRFDELNAALPAYSGFQSRTNQYQNLGYLWLDETVTVATVYEIFIDSQYWRPFPRRPLVAEVTWRDRDLVLINNHLKCCGDGVLDRDDPDDEENRRLVANQLLEQWIDTVMTGRAVILLGDLNDLLTDAPAHNVFEPFHLRPDRYRFADQAVAEGPASGWSWGPARSHLDHILVNGAFFAALDAPAAVCRTLRIDQAMDSGEYRRLLSDHAPVVLVVPGRLLDW